MCSIGLEVTQCFADPRVALVRSLAYKQAFVKIIHSRSDVIKLRSVVTGHTLTTEKNNQ